MGRTNTHLTQNAISLQTQIEEVKSDTSIIRWVAIPPTYTSPGSPGDMAYQKSGTASGYLYVCIAPDLWVRNGTPMQAW